MILKISGTICLTMVVCNNSRDIIRYFSTVASEDPAVVNLKIYYFALSPTIQKIITRQELLQL